ncbi:MAG: SDR family oxidoreductase [Bacteroidales bacterium]|jgi:NAD(P)-dependent dehydrogenase (short-subunit alcohol dehydrogenase family)
MNFCNLTGKTILITGASSGIGQQAAITASQQGALVMLAGRDEKRLYETLSMMKGEGHQLFTGDLTQEEAIFALAKSYPEIDGLVHGAGIVGPTPTKFIRQADISRLLRINFETPVLLTARLLLLKKIRNKGSIVFLSTIATQNPYFGGALYTSAKAGLEAYSRSLALELVKREIRSNCLQPGLVNTPLINNQAQEGRMEMMEESLQRYLQKYPMGVGEATDVANAIVFLLSDESGWISGTSIPMGSVMQ